MLGCTEPVTPEFEFKENLIFIDGIASTNPGSSFVTIRKTNLDFGRYRLLLVEDAAIAFENVTTGERERLMLMDGQYVPNPDFSVTEGETWKVDIELPNGARYTSSAEEVLSAVPVSDLKVDYDPELEFREISGGRFIPGHRLSVSLQDPAERENYYYWTYSTYENLNICEKCSDSYFRNGSCVTPPSGVARLPAYYLYICDTTCWRIRFSESIAIYSDEFSNGRALVDFPIGNLPLYTKENMVVEVQQFSISAAAYDYYRTLKDLVDNNSGLNAPPPAALIGNMFNPDDPEDFVFGRFTVASAGVASAFIERSNLDEEALEPSDRIVLEQMGDPVPPPVTTSAPCTENRFRTAVPPEGWME